MFRPLHSLVALAVLVPASALAEPRFTREANTDRSGNDIRVLKGAPDASADDCERQCRATPGCVAFTYVKMSSTVPEPLCRVKDAQPYGHASECCTSGALKK